jgi:hypothetical protein
VKTGALGVLLDASAVVRDSLVMPFTFMSCMWSLGARSRLRAVRATT